MLFAALAATLVAAAPPKPFVAGPSVEGVSEYRLPNGLLVLLVPDNSKPSTTVNLTVFVGSRHENYGEKGMAHLFEHMLFKKTKRFADVKAELTKLGGSANGTTWLDRTNYFESFPASDKSLTTALELEAERLRSAIISREQLATEMTVVRNEFERGENQPDRVLEERLLSSAYLWHNYGDSTIGARSDIENVPNDKLLAFYETYYQPDNAMLVVAGKFDETKTLGLIANTFGKLPKPKRDGPPKTYTVEPTHDGETTVTVRRIGGAPVVMAGYHVPSAADPDSGAVAVLESLLGESPAGRLYKELVESKKAARVSCSNFAMRENGYFFCTAQLNQKDPAQPAREGLVSVMEGVTKRAPTKDEVERAKAPLLKQYALLLNSSEEVGLVLSEFAAAGDWRLMFLSRDRIEAVTPDDVTRVAGTYFKPSNRTVGEYVPTEKPDRAELKPMVDARAQVEGYVGRAAIAQGEAFDATPANIDARTKRSALPGGLKLALLSKKTRGETVHATLQLKYGSEASLQGKRAAGDAAGRMLVRGTTSKSRQQIKDALDALQAQVRLTPAPQGLTVSVEVRRPQLAATIDLIADVLRNPAFDATEFEQYKRESLAALERQKDDPQTLGFNGLQRQLSPFKTKGHPLYVSTVAESIADLSALKVEDLRAFHARFYGAHAGYAAFVGDFDEQSVSAQLEKHFGAWSAKEPYARIAVPFVASTPGVTVIDTPDKQMAVFVAGTVFKLKESDPDFPAMVLSDYMLGGGFLNGRIPQRLREKDGLSYGAGTFLNAGTHDDFAAVTAYAIYAPQNVEKVEQGFHEELTLAVAKGFTDKELALAREGLLKEMEQGNADDAQLSNELVKQLDLGRTMAFEQRLVDAVNALTLAEINRTLKTYVDDKAFTVVKAGDFKKIAPPK